MKFEGEIAEVDLLRMLLELAHGGFTGAIRFERDDIIKILYLREGTFLSASTNDRADSLDEILLKSSKVSKEHIRQALSRRKEDESLGDALLGLGFITRKELAWVRRVQLVGIIRSLLGWSEGGYTLVHDYLPRRDEGTAFGVAQILVEVLVTSEDRSAADAEMEGGQAVFVVPPGGRESFEQLGLNEDAEQVLDNIDGTRMAADIAGRSNLDAFSVYKLLRAFELVGVTERVRDDGGLTALPLDASDDLQWDSSGEEMDALDLSIADDEPYEPQPLPSATGRDSGEKEGSFLAPIPPIDASASDEDPGPAATGKVRSEPVPPARARSRALPLLLVLVGLVLVGVVAWWMLGRAGSEPLVVAEPGGASGTVPDAARPADPPEPAAAVDQPEETGADPEPEEAAADTPATATTAAVAAEGETVDPATVPWTWQVGYFCESESVTRALKQGGSDAWQVPVRRDGRNCYRVFWGRFQDQAAARAQESSIPEELQRLKPILVSPRTLAR